MDYTPGMTVTWLRQERGGYGYVTRVPARVIGHTKQRVIIAARLKDGTEKTVRVKAEYLTA